MANIVDRIEEKLEEFRIAGGNPSYIGLCPAVMETFVREMSLLTNRSSGDLPIREFLGIAVITMTITGEKAPSDGIYIHDKKD